MNLKVLSPTNKKDFVIFTLRDVNDSVFDSLRSLKSEVLNQVGDSVVAEILNFQIGYFVRSEKKWINNARDLKAVHQLKSTNKITLWCTGKTKRTRSGITESDDENDGEPEPTRAKRNKQSRTEEVELDRNHLVAELCEKHDMEVPTP